MVRKHSTKEVELEGESLEVAHWKDIQAIYEEGVEPSWDS